MTDGREPNREDRPARREGQELTPAPWYDRQDRNVERGFGEGEFERGGRPAGGYAQGGSETHFHPERDERAPPSADALDVGVEGESVVIRSGGRPELMLTAEAAAQSAERLWEAAEQIRHGRDSGAAPFPPAELVSPRAGG